jgi:hypothetical protein
MPELVGLILDKDPKTATAKNTALESPADIVRSWQTTLGQSNDFEDVLNRLMTADLQVTDVQSAGEPLQ